MVNEAAVSAAALFAVRYSPFAFRYYLTSPKIVPNPIDIAYISEDGE
jgi:hypothetical protein